MNNLAPITRFRGGDHGPWRVVAHKTLCGPVIPAFAGLSIDPDADGPAIWQARGFNSNLRYTAALERRELLANGAPPDRHNQCAVLIPMSKNTAWWAMAQDERLAVYARSRHMRIGMAVLPAVFRKLYHCRDLGEAFDFLTWFEFAPDDEPAFDAMLRQLRASEEWDYVNAESEIRLQR
jgi:Chlorite dismutase